MIEKENIITKKLLWSCIEEGTGFYEHVWELNTLFPQNKKINHEKNNKK